MTPLRAERPPKRRTPSRLAFWLGVGALFFAGCSGRPEPPSGDAAAPRSQSFTGFLSTVVGDPAPPGGAPSFFASLTTAEGRMISLSADSAHAALLRELPRFGSRRVEVVGQFRGADTTTLWIERVDTAAR